MEGRAGTGHLPEKLRGPAPRQSHAEGRSASRSVPCFETLDQTARRSCEACSRLRHRRLFTRKPHTRGGRGAALASRTILRQDHHHPHCLLRNLPARRRDEPAQLVKVQLPRNVDLVLGCTRTGTAGACFKTAVTAVAVGGPFIATSFRHLSEAICCSGVVPSSMLLKGNMTPSATSWSKNLMPPPIALARGTSREQRGRFAQAGASSFAAEHESACSKCKRTHAGVSHTSPFRRWRLTLA
jgi:hypothetical protein